ncbi:hypothetical protein GmHk_10G029658 [Glycine max]|nr:hypothetical protein GmHk_10G029658 [Glycine max]
MVLPSHPIGPTLTKVANQKHLRLHKVVVSCHRHQPLVRGQSSERIMHLSPFENMQHPLFDGDRITNTYILSIDGGGTVDIALIHLENQIHAQTKLLITSLSSSELAPTLIP